MASVTSLDKDLRNMRLSKYTPKAANEIRDWIEEVLGEKLPAGDLLENLKDGVALCKLVNLAVGPPGVKYKTSSMPFVQMENISHFLKACQLPPLNLQPHDVFLTVDLYESKDPAQVLQCISAFSRVANAARPAVFKQSIGPKNRNSVLSPQGTGNSNGGFASSYSSVGRNRGASNASQSSSSTFNPLNRPTNMSPSLTGGSNSSKTGMGFDGATATVKGPVSSWSKKADEGATAPAWNIHQYGYMGGASQGNQGIAFGARRQITSPAPAVPNMADKERRRREEQAEKERQQSMEEELERQRQAEKEAAEERERLEEEQRWAEETKHQRELERRHAEEERRKWEEEERRWKAEEERRLKDEREKQGPPLPSRGVQRSESDIKLQGQFLSQYRADQARSPKGLGSEELTRVQQLEKELEQARERERQYERERQERLHKADRYLLEQRDMSLHLRDRENRSQSRSPEPDHRRREAWRENERQHLRETSNIPARPSPKDSWRESERDYLRREWSTHHEKPFGSTPPATSSPRPLPEPVSSSTRSSENTVSTSSRPIPSPTRTSEQSAGTPSRPLPDPATYSSASNRTDRFLSSNPAPAPQKPQTYRPTEFSFDSTAERDAEDRRREAAQTKTKAGGWASKSLLEREMELERQRQQEWEESQKHTKDAAGKGVGAGKKEATVGEGGSWDVNQYGWTGGDSQNRVAPGLGLGGARRQIIGPRPPP
ncbi:MAG: hypothetical protein M1824_000522 [Vezdaea acicularis]|nr:MAG: hypothetical protein M1824_000522 [Vezdaea acicularis]